MPVVPFEITKYKVLITPGTKLSVREVDTEYQGWIHCFGEKGQYNIYFIKDGSPIPTPRVYNTRPTFGRAAVYLEYRYMPIYLDILRNEKPIYAIVDSDSPDRCRIQTMLEDIGEDDD